MEQSSLKSQSRVGAKTLIITVYEIGGGGGGGSSDRERGGGVHYKKYGKMSVYKVLSSYQLKNLPWFSFLNVQ